MHRLILGFSMGFVLSLWRVPSGMDWISLPLAGAEFSYGLRALSWLALAIVVFVARAEFRDGRPATLLVVGAVLGFASHALVLAPFVALTGLFTWALSAALMLVLAFVIGMRARVDDEAEHFSLLRGLTCAGAAAGATVALEGVARHARLLGGHMRRDDSAMAVTLALCLLFGAVAFGGFLRGLKTDRARGRVVPTAAGLAAIACYSGLAVIVNIASPRGFGQFMRNFGMNQGLHEKLLPNLHLDSSHVGMFTLDGLVAVPSFILPAFALGTALYCARSAWPLISLFLGAAAGHLIVARFMALPSMALEAGTLAPEATRFSAELIPLGTLIAGCALLLDSLSRGGAASRLTSALLGGGCVAAALLIPVGRLVIVEPWRRVPSVPTLSFEGAAGLFTVEPSGSGHPQALLDRRPLTPGAGELEADLKRLHAACSFVADDDGFDVLLIGQLTPQRASLLTSDGARRIDRTGVWHDAMIPLEAELFGASERPPGDILSPRAARSLMRLGSYDLIVVPAVRGTLDLVPSELVATGSVLVAFFDAADGAAALHFDADILLVLDGLERMAMGVVQADAVSWQRSGRLAINAGSARRARTPWSWLGTPSHRRDDAARVDFTARLAGANPEGENADLCAGLALHFAAQHFSSPFDTAAQKIELTEAALTELQLAALARAPHPVVREIWNGIARSLAAKRKVELIFELIPPIAESWPPWIELETVLALAEMESLEPRAAIERLAPLFASDPTLLEVGQLLADAYSQAGDHQPAHETLYRMLVTTPSDELYRAYVIELRLAEDPRAMELIEELLLEDPEDEMLMKLLGPIDGIDTSGFRPRSQAHDH